MTSTAMDRSSRGVPYVHGRLNDLARLELGFDDIWLIRAVRRFVGWLRTPPGMLGCSLAIALVCGVLVHERCLAVAGSLGLVIATGWYVPGVIVRNARVRLDFESERVMEGDEIVVNVRIDPREAVPLVGLTIETGAKLDAGEAPEDGQQGWSFRLPAFWPVRRGRLRRQVRRRAERRGIYRLDRAVVSCAFPFRVRESRAKVESDGFLIVRPRIWPIREWPGVTIGSDDFGQMMSPSKGSSGDTTGLREYRRGDDPRRIHWPQTARLGYLVMREQQRSTNPRMSVRLEDPSHYSGWQADWAVRLAASFLAGAERIGWQCDLDMGDDGSDQRRRFHGRETGIYLDLLAGFGDGESLGLLASDMASDEIPRERFQLAIVPAGFALPHESDARAVIVLGEIPPGAALPGGTWLHFENEADLRQWLDRQGSES